MAPFFLVFMIFLNLFPIPSLQARLSPLQPSSLPSPQPPTLKKSSSPPLEPSPASLPSSPPTSPLSHPSVLLCGGGLACGGAWYWYKSQLSYNPKILAALKIGTLGGLLSGLAFWVDPLFPAYALDQSKRLFTYMLERVIKESLRDLFQGIQKEVRSSLRGAST